MAAAQYYDVVQKMYVGYFGRPADPAGLQYWAEQLSANGGDMSVITTGFGNSAEAKTLWGNYDAQVAIDTLYQQLFNRSAEPAGLIYWTNKIASGAETLATIARALAEGAQNDDVTTLAKKVAVAARYTDVADDTTANILAYKGDAAAAAARAQLKNVTKDTDATTFDVTVIVTAVAAGSTSATGSTYTLTTGVDTGASFTGTANNDTFVAVDSGTDTSDTFNSGDSLDGGAGTDTLTITAADNDQAVTTLANIENVKVKGAMANTSVITYSAASWTGVSTVTLYDTGVDGSAFNTLTLNNLQNNVTLALSNVNVTADSNLVMDANWASGKVGSATANLAITTDSVGTSTKDAEIQVDTAGTDVFTTLTVAATNANYLELSAGDDADVELTSVTVTGTGSLTLTAADATVEWTGLKTFDASANTGGVTFDANTSTQDLTFTGGAGNDTLTAALATQGKLTLAAGAGDDTVTIDNGVDATAATLNSTDSINGGDGTDTIVMTSGSADAIDGDTDRSVITNFERLRISDDLNGTTIDMSKFGLNYAQIGAVTTTGAATLNGFTSGATVEYRAAGDSTVAVNVGMTGATSAGTNSDALTIALNSNLTANAINNVELGVDGINLLTVTTADSSNSDGATDKTEGYFLTLTSAKSTNVSSITVTGDRLLDYDVAAGTTALQTLDASAATGQTTFDLNAFAGTQGVTVKTGTVESVVYGGSKADAITGGAGADVLQGLAGDDVIVGGAGADFIDGGAGQDTMTGGDGADTFVLTAVSTASSSGIQIDVITDLDMSTDKIFTTGTAPTAIANQTTNVDSKASVYDALNDTIATAVGANNAGTFTYNGATYLFVNDGTAALGTADYVAKITGASGTLTTSSFATSNAITGTGGGDRITGTSGADTINAGFGGDVITGGAGADTINLGASDSASDTIIFSGQTDALNGSDTITNFQTADVYNLGNLITSGAIANTTVGTAITLATTGALATEGTAINVADERLYVAEVANKAAIDTIADIVTALTDGGVMDAVDFAANADAVLVVGGADDDTTHYVYAVNNDGTAAIVAGELALIGIVTTDITNGVDGLLTSNFAYS